MYCNLVAFPVHLLHGRVISVLVRDEEGGLDVATIRILAFSVEDLFVETDIVVIDGIVEGYRNHLRHVLARKITGYARSIFGTEAIGKYADGRVTRRRAVRIVVHVCDIYEKLIT